VSQPPLQPTPHPLTRLPDGTVKQVNPLTGTKVWTLPGRAARPVDVPGRVPLPIEPGDRDRHCAFCAGRKLETTPEVARVVRTGDGWTQLRGVLADELDDTVAEFRLVPNLYEILGYDYWHLTHGFEPTPESQARRAAYLSTPAGHAHVTSLARIRMRAKGARGAEAEPLAEDALGREAAGLFAANHQVVVARRHYVDDAVDDTQLAASGTLTPDEHEQYVRLGITAMHDIYRGNPYARYVSVYQNWLAPAGASFEHLHKQVVAIDELSAQKEVEVRRVRSEPGVFLRWGARYAEEQGLVVARSEHAVAFAGVGHRYPALVVHLLDGEPCPWELSDEQVRDFSDLVHACHAATGDHVPSNEEWHHRPPSVDVPMPLRAVIKWRISTLAGFEGGTKIYVNTIDPWTLRDRAVGRLRELADTGGVSPRVEVAA
jgi:galactose-1-phosphate uridylyltransferase